MFRRCGNTASGVPGGGQLPPIFFFCLSAWSRTVMIIPLPHYGNNNCTTNFFGLKKICRSPPPPPPRAPFSLAQCSAEKFCHFAPPPKKKKKKKKKQTPWRRPCVNVTWCDMPFRVHF